MKLRPTPPKAAAIRRPKPAAPGPAPLRVFSTCSGISAASVAWKPLGFEIVGFAEVDPFACHVLAQRCGATAPRRLPEGFNRANYAGIRGGRIPNFGDLLAMTNEDLASLGRVDIIEGGTPCQGFSVAGLRAGLSDPRGMLTLAFVRLVHRMRRINGLTYVIWENVDGIFSTKGNPFGHFLAGLGTLGGRAKRAVVPPGSGWTRSGHLYAEAGAFAWRTLDAQCWGVPARRKRVFLVGCLGARGPDPLEILGERGTCGGGAPAGGAKEGADETIRHSAAVAGSAGGAGRAVAFVAGQDSKAAGIGASETVSPCLKASASGSSQVPLIAQLFDRQAADCYADSGVASTLRSNSSAGYDHDLVVHPRVVGTLCKSGAGLTRASGQANEADFCIVQPSPVLGRRSLVRRLMPVEAERLQGFPDGWTDVMYRGAPAADAPRYGGIGNSIAVPCLRFIGERLLAEHLNEATYESYLFAERIVSDAA